MIHAELQIKGMSCNHCVMAVRNVLSKLRGVVPGDVRVGGATVDFDESQVSRASIEAAVREAGYSVASWSQGS